MLKDVALLIDLSINEHVIIGVNNIDATYKCHQLLVVISSKDKSKKELDENQVKCTWLDRFEQPAPLPHATTEEMD